MSGRQLWIAQKLREAGLNVVEEPRWQSLGSADFDPQGTVFHHTASKANANNPVPSLYTVTHGRPDVAGPLCNVLVGRDCSVHVIAAGRANHAGAGGWRGLTGNRTVFGVEAENNGLGEPWDHEMLVVCVRVCAVLLGGIGKGPDKCCGHKEWAPRRKIDPTGIDMGSFRLWVAGDMPTPPPPHAPAPPPAGIPQPKLPTLREGMSNLAVRHVQHVLRTKANQKSLVEDGVFGTKTTTAVKNLQRFFGLTPDGIVGPKTWEIILLIQDK